MRVLTFVCLFRKTAQLSFVFFLYRLLLEMSQTAIIMLHMIKACKIGDLQKGDQEATDLQRRSMQSSRFAKKGSAVGKLI